MTYNEIRERMRLFQERQFVGGVADGNIFAAQAQFEGTFPADLVEYLRNLGAGHVGSEEFIDLGGPKHLDVVHMATHLREPSTHGSFPRSLVPLRDDGFGSYDCVDLLASTDSQSQVVVWQHDAHEQPAGTQTILGLWVWFDQILDIVSEDG